VTVKTYKPRRISNPFEKEVHTYLTNALGKTSEAYLLFGPLRIGRRELDGLVIGQGFMAALEVKAVKGHVSMDTNTPVTVRTETGELLDFEDRHEDPYDQAEKHWKELGNFMENAFGKTEFWFTSMLVFEAGSSFEVPIQAREPLSPEAKIVGLDEVPKYLKLLSARYNKTDLTPTQEDVLIKAITKGAEQLSEAEQTVFARPSSPAQKVTPSRPATPPPLKVTPTPPIKIRPQSGRKAGTAPPPKPDPLKIKRPYKVPWHRSALFLWLAFFFLNPLWAFLMLKDQTRSWSLRLVGTLFLLGYLLACLGGLYLLERDPGMFGLPITATARAHTPSPQETELANTHPPTSAPPTQTESLPNPGSTCTIVWVETGSEGLANKNRAMVWEETIRGRIAGSGMTDRQFYDQVLEHNPELKSDGYVFLRGKTYELPQCE